jgi:hypothetical protein
MVITKFMKKAAIGWNGRTERLFWAPTLIVVMLLQKQKGEDISGQTAVRLARQPATRPKGFSSIQLW